MDDNDGKRLSRIESQLDDIKTTLSKMAVQDEKITQTAGEVSAIWKKLDKLADDISGCRNWQASCPRTTVNWMWCVLIPMGLGILYMIVNTAHK
jgi:hypothetical protein